MENDFFELLNVIDLVFVLWVDLIDDLLNLLFDGIFSVFGDILFWIMFKMIFLTLRTEEISIKLAVSGQFHPFVILACEQFFFENRLSLISDLMIFCLKMMICILDFEIEMI
jgi:hypothetical protein